MEKPSPSQKVRRPRSSSGSNLWMLSGLWMEMLASMLGLGLLGFGIDRWLGWFPVLTIVGIVLGLVGGLYNAAKKAMGIQNPTKENDSSDPPQR